MSAALGEGLGDVVVIGASAAGLAAADALREGGHTGVITVLGAERHHPYDRPSLSKGLLLQSGEAELLSLRSPERLAENRLDLRLGHAAVGLDVDRRYVVTSHGEAIAYDAVIIACGARPREFTTVDGRPLPTLRTPDDLRALRQAAARYGAVTVVGAGLIGLEIASGLRQNGVEVTVLGDTALPMEHVLGPEVATAVADLHRSHGVHLQMSSVVESVAGEPGRYVVHLADGSEHETPYVLAGVGAVPDVAWLEGSGVAVDAGVLTDAAGRTNVVGVWAAGDVARSGHPHFEDPLRIEHWTHAVEKGRHVGLNVARGTADPYEGVPYFWSDQFGRRFHCYGRRDAHDTAVVVEGALTDDSFLVLFGSHGRLHAAFASGNSRALRTCRKLLARGATWDEALGLLQQAMPSASAAAQP